MVPLELVPGRRPLEGFSGGFLWWWSPGVDPRECTTCWGAPEWCPGRFYSLVFSGGVPLEEVRMQVSSVGPQGCVPWRCSLGSSSAGASMKGVHWWCAVDVFPVVGPLEVVPLWFSNG
jgi:hypothetical protein